MPEIGPEHPITYRQELAAPLFQMLRACESGAVVGAAGMGKSRLIQFILRPDVRTHYLGDEAESFLFVQIECNRLAVVSEWGLCELLLTALIEVAGEHPVAASLRNELNQLGREVIVTGNVLPAQRHVELAVRMLCKGPGLKLGLLFDEFDELYCNLPAQTLANLRALRDANKYWLSFLLFLRDHPAQLRPVDECEGFYELFSRSVLGLTPYSQEDARRIIQQVAARRKHKLEQLDSQTVNTLLHLSGGHPGLLVALLDALVDSIPLGTTWTEWAEQRQEVREECRKIWEGLRIAERQTLNHLAQQISTGFQERQFLLLKGLLREESPRQFTFFSPLFERYSASQTPLTEARLHVDEEAGGVWVNGRQSEPLTAKEFKLLTYLNQHLGEIRAIDQIIQHVYPGAEGYDVDNNAIAALVKRVRDKIEPISKRPQYLINVKGRGYKLLDRPE